MNRATRAQLRVGMIDEKGERSRKALVLSKTTPCDGFNKNKVARR